MTKRTILLLAASLIYMAVNAQSYSRTLQTSSVQPEGWLAPAPDNGCYVASTTGPSLQQFMLTRLSASGEVVWSRKSEVSCNFYGLVSDETGNVFAMYLPINSSSSGVVLAKYTPEGLPVWKRQITDLSFSGSHSPLVYQNGRIYLVCTVGSRQRLMAIESQDGYMLWSESFINPFNNQEDDLVRIEVLQDGSLLLSVLSEYFTADKIYRSLLHFDQNGNLLKTRTFKGFCLFDMATLPNGNIAFSAYSDTVIVGSIYQTGWYIGVMTPNLDFLELKKVTNLKVGNITGIASMGGGDFSAVVHHQGLNCTGANTIYRFNDHCDTLWAKTYPGLAPYVRTTKTTGAGLVWASVTNNLTNDLLITQLDSTGTLATCPPMDNPLLLLKDTLVTSIVWTWDVQMKGIWQDQNPDELAPYNLNLKDYCHPTSLDISFTPNKDSVCMGEQIILQASQAIGFLSWEIGPDGSLGKKSGVSTCIAKIDQAGQFLIQLTQKLGGCSFTYERYITVLPSPTAISDTQRNLCEGDSISLVAGLADTQVYEWSTGSTAPAIMVSAAGVYTVKVQDDHCSTTDTIEVMPVTSPSVQLGPDVTPCADQAYTLSPQISGDANTFLWTDGSSKSSLTITEDGIFTLLATNSEGCSGTDTVAVVFQTCPPPLLYIPNVFAPESAGENRLFMLSTQSIILEDLYIYDRWGNQLFHTSQEPFSWDGQANGALVMPGVYAYLVRYRDVYEGRPQVAAGDVTVLR